MAFTSATNSTLEKVIGDYMLGTVSRLLHLIPHFYLRQLLTGIRLIYGSLHSTVKPLNFASNEDSQN